MKQNTFKALVIASVMTVTGAVLPAAAAERLHVNVPFSFMAGGAKLPAGEYNITQSENGMVTVTGAKASAMFLTVPSEYSKSNNTSLSFTAGDAAPILTGIQIMGSVSREVPLRNSERKAALASAR